jgi:hypothetical protein
MFDSETAPLFSLGELALDAAAGAVAMIAIACLALALGGFMFFAPWLIVAPPIMFASGVLRGSGEGKVWFKTLSITSGTLLILIGFSHTNALTVTDGFLIAAVPTAGGIWFRRRSSRRKAEASVHEQ